MRQHVWIPDVAQGGPIFRCAHCPVIWWPDRREPTKKPCRNAPGATS